ncbi:MAG: threonine/serine exporter family protein, partial [Candidatus Binatia bacterium]
MDVSTILLNSFWAALFATGLGILLTAPFRYIVATFLCGFSGRFVRDVLMMSWGMSQNWSTVVAAAVLVLVAVAMVKQHKISPVVLICGVLPLGAAVAMFNVIFELMKVSSLEGEALSAASVALSANTGKAFIGTLAIALGLGAGVALV